MITAIVEFIAQGGAVLGNVCSDLLEFFQQKTRSKQAKKVKKV